MTEFSLPGRELADAAAWAARLIPARPTTPVLAGVVLDAEQGEQNGKGLLTLRVFDFDTAGSVTLDAEVDDPGRILVSGNLLAAVTKTLGAKDVAHLHHGHDGRDGSNPSDTTVALDVGKAAGWELPTLDHRDYPNLPALPDVEDRLDATELADALIRVLPAVGNEKSIVATQGVYLSAEQNGPLVVAATDRYRLAYVEVPRSGVGTVREMLIPTSLAKHIATSARASGGEVALLGSEGMAGLSGPRHSVAGRLYEESVPWRRILLDEQTAAGGRWLFEAQTLHRAVERAATVLGTGESLTLALDGPTVTVAPTLGGKGRASHTCEALDSDDVHGVRIGVSGEFLRIGLDFCAVAPQVELRTVAKPNMPFLLRPCDGDGQVLPGASHVIAQQRQAVAREAA